MPTNRIHPEQERKLREIAAKAFSALTLPPPIRVSQWAEENRHLSSEASAEKGRWRNRPFQSEPMDCLTPDSPYQQVVLMFGSQIVKTETIINFLGYIVDRDPGPVLIVEPRETDAKSFSRDRLAPMFRDTPCLHGKVKLAGGYAQKGSLRSEHITGNSVLHKKFAGGHVSIVGSNSPAGLAMRPIRYLMLDEVDRYPASAGNEGDPVMLAIRRTDEFVWNKKILMCSTPTLEGHSRIAQAYESSDQRRPHVPCPVCGEYQELDFYRLEWEKDRPDTCAYRCQYCNQLIPHFRQPWMLSQGRWVITKPESRIAGFWLSQMYSTRRTWPELAAEFLLVNKNPSSLRVFVNTCLAQTWKDRGEAPDWQRLYERAEPYPLHKVPEGGLFLTAGADVQEDRIEIMVTAWGRDKQSWLVDYIVLEGSVRQKAPLTLPDGSKVLAVWDRLSQIANSTWEHENGMHMPLVMLAIDCGWATQEVYAWGRQMGPGKVMVVRGSDTVSNRNVLLGTPIAVEVSFGGQKVKHGTKFWPVNGSLAKHELYGWLRMEKPTAESGDPYPPGYCHFPQMSAEFFKQLTAEALEVKVDRRGYRSYQWIKHGRNEVLDTRIYARAAAHRFGLDKFGVKDWRALEASLVRRKDDVLPLGSNVVPASSPDASSVPEQPPEAAPPTAPAAAPVQRTMLGKQRRGNIYQPNWSRW